MRNSVLLVLLCMSMVVACGTIGSDLPAFGQPGASVERIPYAPVGVYTFNFKRDKIYTLAPDRRDAVKKYLDGNLRVLPPNCSLGVVVQEIIDGENGDSAASFKCMTAEIKRRVIQTQ